jgi:hypothetical protein
VERGGIHERPLVVLNVEGYYGRVLAWVQALYIRLDNGSRLCAWLARAHGWDPELRSRTRMLL